MIESNRYCPDIINQLHAVRSAIKSAEANILKTHLEACFKHTLTSKQSTEHQKQDKIDEIINLFKKYNN